MRVLSEGRFPRGLRADDAEQTFPFSYSGTLAVTTGNHRLYNDTGRMLVISQVRASVGTAPTGSSVIVDVNLDGSTIYTTASHRPAIAVSTNTDTAVPDYAYWDAGSYLTVDIDQIGSSTAGSDLTVVVTARPYR